MEAIKKVIEYLWENEMRDFQECYDLEAFEDDERLEAFESADDIREVLREKVEGYTEENEHIFITLFEAREEVRKNFIRQYVVDETEDSQGDYIFALKNGFYVSIRMSMDEPQYFFNVFENQEQVEIFDDGEDPEDITGIEGGICTGNLNATLQWCIELALEEEAKGAN